MVNQQTGHAKQTSSHRREPYAEFLGYGTCPMRKVASLSMIKSELNKRVYSSQGTKLCGNAMVQKCLDGQPGTGQDNSQWPFTQPSDH